MNRLYQGALALLLAGLGAMTYKALRYRSDARTWHERWLSLHADPAHRSRFAADNERLRNEGVVSGRVVFLGASITEQLDLAAEFPTSHFVNRGDGGQLVWQQLLRVESDALSLRPEMVVLKMCAINLLPDAPPFDETQSYYAQLADRVRSHGVKVVHATTVPVSRTWDRVEAGGAATGRIRRFNEWLRDTARMRHELVLDYAAALGDDEGYLPDALTADGLHPRLHPRLQASHAPEWPPAPQPRPGATPAGAP